jgi:hypothetical protein
MPASFFDGIAKRLTFSMNEAKEQAPGLKYYYDDAHFIGFCTEAKNAFNDGGHGAKKGYERFLCEFYCYFKVFVKGNKLGDYPIVIKDNRGKKYEKDYIALFNAEILIASFFSLLETSGNGPTNETERQYIEKTQELTLQAFSLHGLKAEIVLDYFSNLSIFFKP